MLSSLVRRSRLTFGLVGLAVIATLALSCGGSNSGGGSSSSGGSGNTDGTLKVGVASDCGSPDFQSVAGMGGGNWVCQLGVTEAPLITKSKPARITPWLAESYTVATDGMSRTVKLRQGITFQDGEPLNAEAVKFNFERIMGLASYSKFEGGQGATFKRLLDNKAPITVLDEYTYRVNFIVKWTRHRPREPDASAAAVRAEGWRR